MVFMRIGLILLMVVAVALAGCTGGAADGAATGSDTSDSTDTGGNGTTTNGGSSDTGENTIVFTDSGFEPSSITIQQGETVTWVDQSSRTMWVASDRHPTHTQYDGTTTSAHCPNDGDAFDQCGTGERYTFTFDKTGEWGYHNHKPLVRGGTITVR